MAGRRCPCGNVVVHGEPGGPPPLAGLPTNALEDLCTQWLVGAAAAVRAAVDGAVAASVSRQVVAAVAALAPATPRALAFFAALTAAAPASTASAESVAAATASQFPVGDGGADGVPALLLLPAAIVSPKCDSLARRAELVVLGAGLVGGGGSARLHTRELSCTNCCVQLGVELAWEEAAGTGVLDGPCPWAVLLSAVTTVPDTPAPPTTSATAAAPSAVAPDDAVAPRFSEAFGFSLCAPVWGGGSRGPPHSFAAGAGQWQCQTPTPRPR
jgi:hypothetical protein